MSASRILLLEDSPLDAELVIARLDSAGLGSVRHVDGKAQYLQALEECRFALILSDYDLPDINGFEALRVAREKCPEVPFVFFSGKLGEEHAVDALRQGATDYVTKLRPERLLPAIQRALSEAHERAELRRSREQMEIVVKGANVGVWYCPLPFDKLIWDEKVKEHFHLPPDADVTIDTFYERLHPDDRQRTRQSIDRSIEQREPYDIDYRTVSPDGKNIKWIRAVGRGFYDELGAPIRFDGVTIDVTERMLAEQRIRQESNIVETINRIGRSVAAELDLAKLVQIVTDATTQLCGAEFGAFFYNVINERGESYALYTISGVPREKFERFPMPRNTALFGPTFNGEGVIRLDDVLQDPRYGKSEPYRGMPKGHLPVRSYLAVPVVSRTGEVLGGLFYGHSTPGAFTERHERIVAGIAAQAAVAIDNARLFDAVKRANAEKDKLLESERFARAEAERASQLKDEFLATLSHELRTPLTAILGWTQVLRRQKQEDPDISAGLSVIERNSRVQAQLVEDLLDMSRIISGKIRLDVQRVQLETVIESAYETVRPAADAKGVKIRKVLDPLAGPVSGDPNRLQQIVWNLLNNAVKFTPRGGKVDLLLERVNSHLEITVHDTGEGISPEFLPHVFDRFRQADGTTTRRHSGLGLGLSIVKHLVELHGGTVRAKSAGVGQGATFVVELPVAPVLSDNNRLGSTENTRSNEPRHPAAAHPHRQEDCYPKLDGVKVLVVDDDNDARELMRHVLEECGASVLVAADAKSAFELLREHRASVLVSDIGMPHHDGYELIRWIRSLPESEGGRTPALALTAFARSEDRRRAIACGYQWHLSKPAEPAELVTIVGSLAGVLPCPDPISAPEKDSVVS